MFRRKSSRGEFQNFTSLFVILIFMGHAIPCAAISQFTMAEIVQRATHADHSLLTDSLTASANLSRLDNGIEITKKILREHKELGSHEKYNYSRLLISAGLLEKARKIALLIPSKGEKAPLRYLALAEISLRKGRLKSGEKLFIRAGNLGEPSGYYMAALSKMKRGNYGAALSLLDKIGDSSPLFSQKVQKTAIALTKSGRSGEAISLIGKSIPLLPGGEEIKKIDLLILKSTLEVNEGVSRGELDQRDWAISSLHEMKRGLPI